MTASTATLSKRLTATYQAREKQKTADLIAAIEVQADEGTGLQTVRSGRIMLKLAPKAGRAAAMVKALKAIKKPSAKRGSADRWFPGFFPGMSTADYVRKYRQGNSQAVIKALSDKTMLCNQNDHYWRRCESELSYARAVAHDETRAFFQPMNENACALYENGALDFDAIETQDADAPIAPTAETREEHKARMALVRAEWAADDQALATCAAAEKTAPNTPPAQALPAQPATKTIARNIIQAIGQRCAAKSGAWEAWLYVSQRTGRQCLVMYRGQSAKPWKHFHFKSRAAALKSLSYYAADAESILTGLQAKAIARREAMAKGHDLTVGDVVHNSWGYDQTNSSFYQVTAVIGKRTVEVRALATEGVDHGTLQGVSVPLPGQFTGPALRKQVDQYGAVNVLNATYGRADKARFTTVAGMRCYTPQGWSSYA
jgi:hypothetical protein